MNPTQAPPVVLTIEDDSAIRLSIASYLEDHDYTVLEAEDGEQGLALFREQRPDLVLTDLRMPGISGLDVLESITEAYPDTPVIVVSGMGEIKDVVKTLKLGAWDYILKPIQDMKILLHAVQKALERARLIEENASYQKHLEEQVQKRTRELTAANKTILLSEKKYREIFENIQDVYFETDIGGTILEISPSVVNISRYGREELIGKPLTDLYEVKDGEEELILRLLGEEKVTDYEVALTDKAQVLRHCSITAVLTRDPSASGEKIIGSMHDITDRLEAAEKIRRMNVELEKRVEERTRDLYTANKALKESLENLKITQKQLIESEKMAALGSLVAGVAHEISTPVGIGVTEASFLEDESNKFAEIFNAGTLKRSDLEKYFKIATEISSSILKNLSKAGELITSFKQVAVEQSIEKRRVFPLHDFINEILLSLSSKLKRTHHRIVVDCAGDLTLDSYPGAFSQVITNLVMNSLLHGFEGIDEGEITFRLAMEEEKVLFLYRDNGLGMEKKHVKKIFEPFFTTKRGSGGTGLGMHIVYNLVTRTLGGTISCTSTPGEYTAFRIELPLTPESNPDRGEDPSVQPAE